MEKLVVLLCDECASGYAGFAESVEGRDRGEEEEGGRTLLFVELMRWQYIGG